MRNAVLAALAALAIAGCTQPATVEEQIQLESGLRRFGYRVVTVVDGNSFVIDLNDNGLERKVRLIGIDTPGYKREFKQAGGHDAGTYLWDLISTPSESEKDKRDGVYVNLTFEGYRYGLILDPNTLRPVENQDQYPAGAVLNAGGEIEAYVFVKGHCVNRLMIDSGFAWVDRNADFARKSEFIRAEERAREQRLGYWAWNPRASVQAAGK